MAKYFKSIILFFAPIASLWVIIVFTPINEKNNDYLSAQRDKINILKNHRDSSIILIGGSNLAFGFDSQYLTDSLRLNTINLGLQASLGVVYQINQSKQYIKQGDIIVVIPEYYQYQGDDAWGTGSAVAKTLMHTNPLDFFKLEYKQQKQVIPYLFGEGILKLEDWIKKDKVDQRNYFDSRGDFVGHLNLKNREINEKKNYVISENVNLNFITKLIEFNNFLKTRNASLYISYPAFPKGLYSKNLRAIESIEESIKNTKNLSLIGTSNDFAFEDNLFFEYPMHLNKKGRAIRTEIFRNKFEKIIRDMNK